MQTDYTDFFFLDVYVMEPVDYGKSEEKSKIKSVKVHFFLRRCISFFYCMTCQVSKLVCLERATNNSLLSKAIATLCFLYCHI